MKSKPGRGTHWCEASEEVARSKRHVKKTFHEREPGSFERTLSCDTEEDQVAVVGYCISLGFKDRLTNVNPAEMVAKRISGQ